MHRSFIPGLLLALVTACSGDPDPAETGASITDACGTGGCDTSTSTTSSTTTTTSGPGPGDSSTTLDCGTGGCCSNGNGFCGDTTTTGGGVSTEAGDSTTGGPGVAPPCGFEATLAMLAMGKTEPTDCGIVTLDDDVTAWQTASECAASAAAAQTGFQVAFQLPSDDSLVFDGYYGVVGFVYGLGNLYTDTFGDPMLQSQSCMDVTTLDGCMVDVGTHCLACLDAGEVVPLECSM